MANETINIPDLGSADAVDVIEISVKPGDEVAAEDTLLVLESDKASMDVPSPRAGVVKKVLVKVGDKVSSGSAIIEMEAGAGESSAEEPPAKESPEKEGQEEKAPSEAEKNVAQEATQEEEEQSSESEKAEVGQDEQPAAKSPVASQAVKLPDLGTDDAVDVIEIAVSVGDTVAEGDALMTLESDKAAMDVPSPYSGKITRLLVGEGDKVKSGDAVAEMDAEGNGADAAPEQTEQSSTPEHAAQKPAEADEPESQPQKQSQKQAPQQSPQQ
ncbi:MAG: biotin/lipoyl-binding protein, partial [Bacteroidales bacterium]|nr:biotin/lipoyl-binding protein [Bacteroidales bacterium]